MIESVGTWAIKIFVVGFIIIFLGTYLYKAVMQSKKVIQETNNSVKRTEFKEPIIVGRIGEKK